MQQIPCLILILSLLFVFTGGVVLAGGTDKRSFLHASGAHDKLPISSGRPVAIAGGAAAVDTEYVPIGKATGFAVVGTLVGTRTVSVYLTVKVGMVKEGATSISSFTPISVNRQEFTTAGDFYWKPTDVVAETVLISISADATYPTTWSGLSLLRRFE